MREFAILLDSTCNLTTDNLKEFDLDYCRMGVSIEDKQYVADLAWPDMTPAEFYNIMKSGKRPYTQQVTEDEYRLRFNQYLNQGKDILYISCSSALSASVKVAVKLARELMEAKPECKIICIDSLNSGMGQGFMGIAASEMRAQGMTLDEVAAIIEQDKLKYNQWGSTGSLTYLKNAGRVKASAAFFGNIFGVKPIIISDIKGNNYAYKKVRGRQASIEELAESVVRTAVDPEHHYLAVDNANSMEDAQKVVDLIEAKGVHFKRVFLNPLGPILGASCGPDTLIAYNYGTEVTLLGE